MPPRQATGYRTSKASPSRASLAVAPRASCIWRGRKGSGGTLAARLTEPLPPRAAARLVESIAGAVHHIHSCGLLHLDLKPSNILLDGDMSGGWDSMNPKVSDFGIARTVEPGASDFRLASTVLTNLVDLSIGAQTNPQNIPLDRMILLLDGERKLLNALCKDRPDDLALAGTLAAVEESLCNDLAHAQRHDEARSVALASLARLDALAQRYPLDTTVFYHRSLRYGLLAAVSERMGRADDSDAFLRRAVQATAEQFRLAPSARAIFDLLQRRRDFAWFRFRRGDRGEAESLAAENIRLIGRLPPGCDRACNAIERLRVYLDGKMLIGDPRHAAGETETWGGLAALGSPTDASQSSEDWARLAAEAIRRGDGRGSAATARDEGYDAYAVAAGRLFPPAKARGL